VICVTLRLALGVRRRGRGDRANYDRLQGNCITVRWPATFTSILISLSLRPEMTSRRKPTARRLPDASTELTSNVHGIKHHAHDTGYRRSHSARGQGSSRKRGPIDGRHRLRAACRRAGSTPFPARDAVAPLDFPQHEVASRSLGQGSRLCGPGPGPSVSYSARSQVLCQFHFSCSHKSDWLASLSQAW
jgi:hypothetical protein